jgi:DNA-binding response OmpR family regulator
MVVTAHPQLALRTQRVLLTAGHSVEVAGTLRRGLAILHHRPPDGVVLDAEARDTHPGDYDALVAAAHEARVALIVLGEAAVEPALLAFEVGGVAAAAPPGPLAAALVEQLRSQGLSAEAAINEATAARSW